MMRTVDSVDEAIAFLEHYRGDHGAMYHHARLMLAGAREGHISVAEARQAFSAFAEDNDLLARVPQLDGVLRPVKNHPWIYLEGVETE